MDVGPGGILLAVPVTASLKIVMERIPATSRIAMLLGRYRDRGHWTSKEQDMQEEDEAEDEPS